MLKVPFSKDPLWHPPGFWVKSASFDFVDVSQTRRCGEFKSLRFHALFVQRYVCFFLDGEQGIITMITMIMVSHSCNFLSKLQLVDYYGE